MLQKGSTEPWPDQLEEFTGNRDMDVGALREYFKPLEKFLREQLADEQIGWNATGKLSTY